LPHVTPASAVIRYCTNGERNIYVLAAFRKSTGRCPN
jgi:hypothetical protein